MKERILSNVGGVWSKPHYPYMYWGEWEKAVMQAEQLAEDFSYARLTVQGWSI